MGYMNDETGAVLVRLPAARSMRNFRLVWAKEEEPCTNMTTAPLQECFSPLVSPHLKSAGQDVTERLGKISSLSFCRSQSL